MLYPFYSIITHYTTTIYILLTNVNAVLRITPYLCFFSIWFSAIDNMSSYYPPIGEGRRGGLRVISVGGGVGENGGDMY
jgi:hypothetical protein